MKKQFTLSLLSIIVSNVLADEPSDVNAQLDALRAEMQTLKTANERLTAEVKELGEKHAADHLHWGADLRVSVDNIDYKMANGSHQRNDSLLTNRLWLNMRYDVSEHVRFKGQLAYNKLFGQRSYSDQIMAGMDGFDWVSSETRQDDALRVRAAAIDIKDDVLFGAAIPWSFGIGRRPSSNGRLISYREDDPSTSPLGHTSNAEFDGANVKFYLEPLTGLKGAFIKFAAGRGLSSAEPRFSSAAYSRTSPNIEMHALNLAPYKSDRLETEFQYTHADNLIDMKNAGFDQFGNFNAANVDPSMEVVGALDLFSAFITIKGLSDSKGTFLGDLIFFVSGAMSVTDPDHGKTMLGSQQNETGYSYWVGTQIPSLVTEKGAWGIEFNHGSKYWRSFTYGEDTAIGSKIAARGNAFEAYMTEPLIDALSVQVRYTFIDYEYTGSNGFFGSQSGTPMKINEIPASTALAGAVVDQAQDIRAYLRYRF